MNIKLIKKRVYFKMIGSCQSFFEHSYSVRSLSEPVGRVSERTLLISGGEKTKTTTCFEIHPFFNLFVHFL